MTYLIPESAMPPLAAAQIAAYRAAGWVIISARGARWPLASGSALHWEGAPAIIIRGDPARPEWLFVFLHEVAHHVLGHTKVISTQADWEQEFAAECWALNMIGALVPDALPHCITEARRHMRGVLRPWVQGCVDGWGAERLPWHIIAWAGCDVPPELQHHLPKIAVTPMGLLTVELMHL